MLTKRLGVTISSFISARRSLPPARMAESSLSSVATCSFLVGLRYSNACIGASLFEGGEDAVGSEGQERHAHSNCIGYSIGDRGPRRYHWRLGQADDATIVVTLAGHHVNFKFTNITQTS